MTVFTCPMPISLGALMRVVKGKSGFHFRGDEGSIEPHKLGEGGGYGKRAQLTGPLINFHELWHQRHRKFF